MLFFIVVIAFIHLGSYCHSSSSGTYCVNLNNEKAVCAVSTSGVGGTTMTDFFLCAFYFRAARTILVTNNSRFPKLRINLLTENEAFEI